MKKHLCSVCCSIAWLISPLSAFAETTAPNSTAASPAISAPLKTNEQSTRKVRDCENEWRANREAMMKYDMDEDRYVEQCSVADDVPAIPSETKPNVAPSAVPK